MLFNSKEIALIITALEDYADSPLQILRIDLRDKLSASITTKLKALTPLTVFTKQEFTLMAVAVEQSRTISTNLGTNSYFLERLRDRLISLAEPVK